MSNTDEKFDGMFMTIAQQSNGIEPLLDNLFSFLRRKTDFFAGASPEKIQELVMEVVKKQAIVHMKDVDNKRIAKEKNEKKKKLLVEKEKKNAEALIATEKAAALAANPITTTTTKSPVVQDDDVLEMGADGEFVVSEGNSHDTIMPPKPPSKDKDKPITTITKDMNDEPKEITDEDENDKIPAPIGNGGKTEFFTWVQTLSETTVTIPLPAGTKAKMLDIEIKNSSLKVGVKGQTPIIKGDFHKRIIVDDSFWTLEDGDVVLNLQKENKMEWWKCVMVGDEEINTQKVQPENSKLNDLDAETRQTVEKMMYDQKQKALGLPSSEEETKQNMMKKFMKAHPEMDFSQAKFT